MADESKGSELVASQRRVTEAVLKDSAQEYVVNIAINYRKNLVQLFGMAPPEVGSTQRPKSPNPQPVLSEQQIRRRQQLAKLNKFFGEKETEVERSYAQQEQAVLASLQNTLQQEFGDHGDETLQVALALAQETIADRLSESHSSIS